MDTSEYCKDALELLNIKTLCVGCPLLDGCPRLILEDATDAGVNGAIAALVKIKKKGGQSDSAK